MCPSVKYLLKNEGVLNIQAPLLRNDVPSTVCQEFQGEHKMSVHASVIEVSGTILQNNKRSVLRLLVIASAAEQCE